MDDPLDIAVIGLGRMGRIHARTLRAEDGTRLRAVVDPAVDPAEILNGAGTVRVFEEAAPALERLDLDGVVIAAPTSMHADLVVEAARAGTDVFCEKPLALSRAETERARAAVDRAAVVLQVGFMRRFDDAYRRVREHVRTGRIGRPIGFRAVGRDPGCPDPAFADPTHSGGLLVDMAIHDFDLARWLMDDEVERVTAEGALLVCDDLEAVGDLDNAVVTLAFEGGGLGTVEVSRNAVYGYDIRTEVLGTEGVAQVEGALRPDTTLLRGEDAPDGDDYLMDRFGAAYRNQIRHFVECIREGRTPAVTGGDAEAAFEVSLAATRSARTGEPVALGGLRQEETPRDTIF